MIDTHCHLNFSRFKKNVDEVIGRAQSVGVENIIIPGTDVPSSQKAIEIAQKYEGLYAAVGIHPHHVYGLQIQNEDSQSNINDQINQIETLLSDKKVVAVGEVGMDQHVYEQTKYEQYNITRDFIELQKTLLEQQIKLAIKYDKSLIFHNREAKRDVLAILTHLWDKQLEWRTVFHCCEPDITLLEYAKNHHIFIGVDGDITYSKEKQEFVKQIPLDMLVLETDSPFLLPEPLRSQKKFPNEPANIALICSYIAEILEISAAELGKRTTENARRLFALPKD